MPTRKSTNVRIKMLRTLIAVLQRTWPAAAVELAARLFATPPRHPMPEHERAALAGARSFDVRLGRHRLRAWRWGHGPTVLLVHGWGGRGAQLGAHVPALLEAGYSVVSFDGPGHGVSSGRLSALPLFAEALLALQAQQGPVRAVIAHSMGAGATALALQHGLRLDAAVFVGPPRSPMDFFGAFAQALGLSPRTQQGALQRLARRFGVHPAELDTARLTERQRLPLLVLHDAADRDVPLAHGREIAERWPGAELVVTQGLGHRRILRDAGSIAHAVAFVSARVAVRCAQPGCSAALAACEGPRLCVSCSLSNQLYERETRTLSAAA